MRLKLVGDHSSYHCGSRAVVEVIRGAYPGATWVAEDDPTYDGLIVNGEGSLHHAASSHRPVARAKLASLQRAVDDGKPAALINTVWQDMGNDHDPLLKSLDFLSVRETLSAQELRARHGVEPIVCPDLSYYRCIDGDCEAPDWTGQVVATDFYSSDFAAWVRATSGKLSGMSYVDLKALGWSQLVTGLRSARLLVTGRHHGVYAAAKAGIPFVAVTSNSHKIEGLLASAGADVPVHKRLPNPNRAVALALDGQGAEFQRLFTWLESQPLRLPSF